MADKLKLYMKISDMQTDKKEMKKEMDKNGTVLQEIKKSQERVESEINSMRHMMGTKATQKEVKDLKGEMDVLATKEDYSKIKVLLTDFQTKINSFKESNDTHAQIIRRFDEIIIDKASRFNVLEIEGNVRKLS